MSLTFLSPEWADALTEEVNGAEAFAAVSTSPGFGSVLMQVS